MNKISIRRAFARHAAGALLLATLAACGGGESGSSPAPASSAPPVTSTPPATTPAVNTAPTLTGSAAVTVRASSAYQFQPTASDAEGDTLMFQISGKPAWASFSVSTGALTGTPAVSDVGGQANIVISVSDGRLSTALPAFALLVQPASVTPPANRAPTISGTPGTTAEVGTAYSFQPTAADADGDALTFTATNLPAWATLDANTGKLSGTPTGAGSHSAIGIAVTDGKVTVSLASFNITVAPVAPPGTIPAATACSSPLTGTHATYNVGGGANAYA
ncbi:MAG: putative Ig domain-containing protein, partial [Pseudomonadota bacterium]